MSHNATKVALSKTATAIALAALAVIGLIGAVRQAQATVFPAQGGKGDRAEEYRCPAGYVLSGFYGQTGAWIDQIGLICSEVLPDMRLGRVTRLHVRGGIGGSPTEQYCVPDAGIRQIRARLLWKHVLENSRYLYVHTIQFTCARPRDGSPAGGGEFKGIDIGNQLNSDLNDSWRTAELCPGNEYATGLNIRYGGHVNAVGLICETIAPAAPPIVMDGTPDLIGAGMENNTDRPGSDYESFPSVAGKPALCQSACLNDRARCRAWTYVRPGLQGPKAMCHLKNAKPAARADKCCISGVAPSKTGGSGFQEPGSMAPPKPSSPPPFVTPPIFPGAPLPGATGPRNCKSGFVWRLARSTDYICVTPESRTLVEQENAVAPTRWNPNGAYGPQTCIAGFVWREAFDGDTVCVTPERRAAVKEENRLAPSRTL
jgi:hypothetical protein